MALHIGWRSFWWLNTGLLALTMILTILGFPETKWDRVRVQEQSGSVTQERKEDPSTNLCEDRKDANRVVRRKKGLNGDESNGAVPQDPYLGKGAYLTSQISTYVEDAC